MSPAWYMIRDFARRRSAALLSEFGLGHVREYAPFDLILSALHLILRATVSCEAVDLIEQIVHPDGRGQITLGQGMEWSS